MEGWSTLWPEGDSSPEWSHSGIAVLPDGRIVFAAPGGAELVLLDEAPGAATRVAIPTVDAHGITLDPLEPETAVWVADPGSSADDGQVFRLAIGSGDIERLASQPGWRPTSTAVVSRGEHRGDLWVADGYGQSLVHRFARDGAVHTFDGSATGLRFDCPHGILIDDRGADPLVVVADRSNRRLVFLDLDGAPVRTLTDSLLTSPSSIAVRGDDLLVTDLFGALLRVGPEDSVSAAIPHPPGDRPEGWPNRLVEGTPRRPVLTDGRLNSPHGIAVSPDGVVYLTEWMLGGRQVRLELPEAPSRDYS
jgi:DNA-binding beta-propeller fold protein YncE